MEPRSQLVPGVPVTLAPGVRRVVAPNGGMMTGTGTNTYLLGTEEFVVIDPGPYAGPDDSTHLQAILNATQGRIGWILVTHTHRDHSPLAAVLARQTGARLLGVPPPGDGRQDESFLADEVPQDGARLRLGDTVLIAVRTPGHASNCVCYLLEHERLLFTGDHVLEGVSPVILPPDGDMSAYLNSLDKLEAYDFERIAPGHGGVLPRGKRMLALLRAHRLAREAKVLESLTQHPTSLEVLTAAVYDDVPAERHPWAQLTLQAHLIKLAREGRAVEHESAWRKTSV